MKANKRVFFNFLKRNKCLKEYIIACNKARLIHNINYKSCCSLRDYLILRNAMNRDNTFNKDSINYAFGWNLCQSIEWRPLHEHWQAFLHKNNFNL